MTNMTGTPRTKGRINSNGDGAWTFRLPPSEIVKNFYSSSQSLDEFMSLLDRYVALGDQEDFVRHHWTKAGGSSISDEILRAKVIEAAHDRKSVRRDLIRDLKKIRSAPAKNLDDILFKAELCAVLDPYEVECHRTLPHSIIKDLLSAGCTWMQPSANE